MQWYFNGLDELNDAQKSTNDNPHTNTQGRFILSDLLDIVVQLVIMSSIFILKIDEIGGVCVRAGCLHCALQCQIADSKIFNYVQVTHIYWVSCIGWQKQQKITYCRVIYLKLWIHFIGTMVSLVIIASVRFFCVLFFSLSFRSRLLCAPISNCKFQFYAVFFSSLQSLSLITKWLNSKWNVINHETNRRPNCMWSILSCAIFSKVSFRIIMVTRWHKFSFLPIWTLDAILSSVCQFVRVVFFFVVIFVFVRFLVMVLKRHNHSKPQIKRNSKSEQKKMK